MRPAKPNMSRIKESHLGQQTGFEPVTYSMSWIPLKSICYVRIKCGVDYRYYQAYVSL